MASRPRLWRRLAAGGGAALLLGVLLPADLALSSTEPVASLFLEPPPALYQDPPRALHEDPPRALDHARPRALPEPSFCTFARCAPRRADPIRGAASFGVVVLGAGLLARRRAPLRR